MKRLLIVPVLAAALWSGGCRKVRKAEKPPTPNAPAAPAEPARPPTQPVRPQFEFRSPEQVAKEAAEAKRKAEQEAKDAEARKKAEKWRWTMIRSGDVEVRLWEVRKGYVLIDSLGEKWGSNDEALIVCLDLCNLDSTKKVEYRTWRGDDFGRRSDRAVLRDNFGNNYRSVTYGLHAYPTGSVHDTVVAYPNQPVQDVLVFQVPLKSATTLELNLPAANFGGQGELRFDIPMELLPYNRSRDQK
jgi:hypothetical protein